MRYGKISVEGSLDVTGSMGTVTGLSGSLTQLTDGTSYLIAGNNITITSQSNGSVVIDSTGGGGGGPSYFESTMSGSIYTSGSSAFVGGGDEWGIVTSPSDKGSDVFFYVSGSISGSGVDDKKSLFGGDVRISGSLSQGALTTASGQYSHAEGYSTIASGDSSHSEGVSTTASGVASHAEGNTTTASGDYSHAEGEFTTAAGYSSHAEGFQTKIRGSYSHAEGFSTRVSGSFCHAEGDQTRAGVEYYYVSDVSPDATPGQGLIQIDSLFGDVTSQLVSPGHLLWDEGMGYASTYVAASFDGTNTYVTASITRIDTGATVTSIDGSTGTLKIAGGVLNPIEDANAGSVSYAHTEGAASAAFGNASHAEGSAITFGEHSHAEGDTSTAYASYSHAEGAYASTYASGSHAEGEYTRTYGYFSHAEGSGSVTLGSYSHAEGLLTIASGTYQHVGGKYNVRGNDFSLFVVGDGTSDSDVDRSDILRINPGNVGGAGSVQVTGSLAVNGPYLLNVQSGTLGVEPVVLLVSASHHFTVFTLNNVTASLPTTAPVGTQLIFKDGTGTASTSPQMLSCSVGGIDNVATFTLPAVNYTSVTVVKADDLNTWLIV